ncbi:hypothetical protein [Streptomyces sp. NPDC101455]|uniref:hypothetical protein n=1 Tax=Streptomyces sp. NPDC101455 TaxID=3366142 RepID=UPI00380E5A54
MSAETRPRTTVGEALALLALPTLDRLAERQSRGIVCVWNARHTLMANAAVNLGAREASRAGEPVMWYPRSCRPCTLRAAADQLFAHCTKGQCEHPNDIDRCATCKGLNRVMREYR